jgi:hypothetical protein
VPRRIAAIASACSVAVLLFALVVSPPAALPDATAVTGYPKIAAVGDVACKNPPGNNRRVCQYDDVSRLVANRGYAKFLLLGDDQYEYGLYRDFVENYDVYFGEVMPITAPVPGNHEYGKSPDAEGYFRYFGRRAHGPGGYYSFDLGGWHIVALNSTICRAGGVECMAGSDQYDWLAADLAASDARCTLAYWHHPRWDWVKYQNADWTDTFEFRRTEPLWNLLYANGADVVLSGHNHNYSRWLPMDDAGAFDPANGITQFVVGTGGRNLNDFGGPQTEPLTFARGQSKSFGVLELTLKPSGYDYRWVGAEAQPSFVDQGTGTCH